MMQLYFYQDPKGNFGDDLNLWLWPKLIPDLVDVTQLPSQKSSDDTLFIEIGTLLNTRVPATPLKVVLGAGVGYGESPLLDERWQIYCVRGPWSAKALNLPSNVAVTDAAVLLRTLDLPSIPKLYSASFMPFHRGIESANWELFCQINNLHYIDPTKPVEEILFDIQSSQLLITEAMHGVIVADALRVPWIPVQIHQEIDNFKWNDWCQSVELEYRPVLFPTIGFPDWGWKSDIKRFAKLPLICLRLAWVAKNVEPTLSLESKITALTDRLQEQLERLKHDFRFA
jgi:succinoglycan biosynthesis protein ExoV